MSSLSRLQLQLTAMNVISIRLRSMYRDAIIRRNDIATTGGVLHAFFKCFLRPKFQLITMISPALCVTQIYIPRLRSCINHCDLALPF